MHERYDYLTTTERESRSVQHAGGVVVAVWSGLGGIGWYDDERMTLVGWPDDVEPPLPAENAIRLHATARPTAIAPISGVGLFAHRWFEIDEADWPEFLELSTEAWPAFEAAYGATIEGFFRTGSDSKSEEKPGTTRVLLITLYPSLTAWEQSRQVLRNPTRDVAESGRRFQRRRELTRRSIVRTGYLVT